MTKTTARDQQRRELTAAASSILRRNGCGADVAELVARELVAAAENRGWRPATGLPEPLRPVPASQTTPATADAPGAAEYRAARAVHIRTQGRH